MAGKGISLLAKGFSTAMSGGGGTAKTAFKDNHDTLSDSYLHDSTPLMKCSVKRNRVEENSGMLYSSLEQEFMGRFDVSCNDHEITSKDWNLVKRMVKQLEKTCNNSHSSVRLSWNECMWQITSFCRQVPATSSRSNSLLSSPDRVLCFIYRKSIDHALQNHIQWNAIMLAWIPDSCIIEPPLLFAVAKLQRKQLVDQQPNTHLLEFWINRFRENCPEHPEINQEEVIKIAQRIASKPFSDCPTTSSYPFSSNTHTRNIDHFTCLLQECLKNDDSKPITNTSRLATNEIIELVTSLGLEPTTAYNHLLLKYYFKVGKVELANTLFEEMVRSHSTSKSNGGGGNIVKTLNCFLNGLFINGLYDEAFQFFEDKFGKVYKATPSATTMTILIKQCVERGLYNAAHRYYYQAQQMQIPFSIVGWESIIHLFTAIDMKRAQSLFEKLKNGTIRSNNKCLYITNNMYLYMIRGYIESKDYLKVLNTCREMQSKRRYRLPLHIAQYAITAQASLEPTRPQKALAIYEIYRKQLFARVDSQGKVDQVHLDATSTLSSSSKDFDQKSDWLFAFYSKILQISHRQPHENQLCVTLSLYQDACKLLKHTNQKDAPFLMHFLVSSYARAGDVKKAWMWFRILSGRGYKLPAWTLDDLMQVLIRRGRREKIQELAHTFLSPSSQDDGYTQQPQPTTELMNGLLYCNLTSSLTDFRDVLSSHDQVAWNGQTFALVLQYYASQGNFLLSWNMWLKYVEWVDDPTSSNKNKGKMQLRVVRTIVSWCIVSDKPGHFVQVWREAVEKNRIGDEEREKLYDIQFIQIPREFKNSRAYIVNALSLFDQTI